MRKTMTYVFYCFATGLILAHLWGNFVAQSTLAQQDAPLYLFSVGVERTVELDVEIDYKKIGEQLSSQKY
ncbi:hypothetical protein [Thaumasiovibrio sp. DFM-14]|uniref:hypothetical protein n=1 Tax=Thaumasiovibrio sp. DFM-14 TaxID=3384792 RepID=UPI00399F2BB2